MLYKLAVALPMVFAAIGPALSDQCPNPDALGVSRVIAIDPLEHRKIGSIQFGETLPLKDHEVVLTFDDGPSDPTTGQVLDALAAECVKVTFFVVGQMAKEFPALLQRAYREGHTIGTHTEHHAHLDKLTTQAAMKEITDGIASARKVLGNDAAVTPFFRFPYLDQTSAEEDSVLKLGLMIWSVDAFVSDWNRITPAQVTAFALQRIERKKKGILLLHDIQGRTAKALPTLLRELKKRDYHVVQVVPADSIHPKSMAGPDQWNATN